MTSARRLRAPHVTVSVALAGLLLSACGGRGQTALLNDGTVPSGSAPAPHAGGTITFVLKVPPHTSESSGRRPQYVSPSMQSLVITLTAQNGTPLAMQRPYAANFGSSACPVVGSAPTCTLSIPASVGTDAFTIATYDAVQSSATPTTLAGNLLSSASTTATVVGNTANTVSLALNGVVASFTLTLGNAAPSTGTAATIPVTITARDIDGNVIVGPGAYRVPITLADTDTTGATTLSTTSVTGPSTAVTIAYTGQPATATFSASAPGGLTASSTLVTRISRMYVSDDTAENVQPFASAGSPTSPTLVTGSAAPQGIAIDRSGNVYSTDNLHNTVKKYNPAGTLLLTISGFGNPEDVAVDAAGNIYVADAGANDVKKYNATGTSTMTISSGLTYPTSVAVDSSGNIYIANFGNNNVEEFGSNGGAPSRTITNGISTPYGVTVDAAGTLYVTNEGGYKVTTYASSGANPAPEITMYVSNAVFNQLNANTNTVTNLFQIAVDPAGNMYVVTQGTASSGVSSLVLVYSPGGGSPFGTPSGTVPSQATLVYNYPTYASFTPYGVAVY